MHLVTWKGIKRFQMGYFISFKLNSFFGIFMQSEDRGISKLDGEGIEIILEYNLTKGKVADIFGIIKRNSRKREIEIIFGILRNYRGRILSGIF